MSCPCALEKNQLTVHTGDFRILHCVWDGSRYQHHTILVRSYCKFIVSNEMRKQNLTIFIFQHSFGHFIYTHTYIFLLSLYLESFPMSIKILGAACYFLPQNRQDSRRDRHSTEDSSNPWTCNLPRLRCSVPSLTSVQFVPKQFELPDALMDGINFTSDRSLPCCLQRRGWLLYMGLWSQLTNSLVLQFCVYIPWHF